MSNRRSARRVSVNSAIDSVATTPGDPAPTSATPATTPGDPAPTSVTPTTMLPTPITVFSPTPSVSRSLRTVEDLTAEVLNDKLPALTATNETEFMTWAYKAMSHFSRAYGFREEILHQPRDSLEFPNMTEAQVDFLYQYVWLRLEPIVTSVSGILHRIRQVIPYDVQALWKLLSGKYVP